MGLLYAKLIPLKKHNIKILTGWLIFFYIRLSLLLFTKGRNTSVYLNEAAHNKYILLLAKIHKHCSFFIHIRINEDTNPARWQMKIPSNLKIFTISKYLQSKFNKHSICIYDPFSFSDTNTVHSIKTEKNVIGVIGRISIGKGFEQLSNFIHYINKASNSGFAFKLSGNPDAEILSDIRFQSIKSMKNVMIMGFCENRDEMYRGIDYVMHFCETEPLGRIYFEAVNYGKPLIGFNHGGIGEIGRLLGLDELLISYSKDMDINTRSLLTTLENVKKKYKHYSEVFLSKKINAENLFSTDKYTAQLDNYLISGNS